MSDLLSKMFVRMSEMTPEPVEWVWDGLIPKGMLTLLTGDPDVGKSQVALQVAAMVTRGVTNPQELSGTVAASTPEGEKRPLAKGGLVLSAADHPEKTVLPRLIAAGGRSVPGDHSQWVRLGVLDCDCGFGNGSAIHIT